MIARLLLAISILLIIPAEFVIARTIQTVAGVYYVVLDTTHSRYSELITRESAVHERIRPGNKLSIVLNNDGTQALVKLIGADEIWKDNELALSGVVVTDVDNQPMIYSRKQHDQVILLLQTPEWLAPPEVDD